MYDLHAEVCWISFRKRKRIPKFHFLANTGTLAIGVDSMSVSRKPLNGGVPCEVSTQSIPERSNRLSDLSPIAVSYERVLRRFP